MSQQKQHVPAGRVDSNKQVCTQNTSAENPATSHQSLQERIRKILAQLTSGMHERDEIMAVALLGAIAGHNTFLFGPPGTAKSLISRRLASAFESPRYFELLMNRFSTPEEVFGPVSIKHLKEDRYVRQIDDYLPTADFAFLDEIWKSSPAILNSLLTIINEHIYKNGDQRINVPLKSLIAASNEVPPESQGLEALYDRFIIRLLVPPIQFKDNFHQLLNSQQATESPEVDSSLRISSIEIKNWRQQFTSVTISKDTFNIIDLIRQELASKFDELKVYVSDRRWQRAAHLMKASAYLNGRTETNHADAVLLKHCLWTTGENREAVEKIVMSAIKTCGFSTDVDIAELDKEKNKLEGEINRYIFHDKDVYHTKKLKDGNEYFPINDKFHAIDRYSKRHINKTKQIAMFAPVSSMKSQDEFKLVDESGNEIKNITGKFDGQGTLTVTLNTPPDQWNDSYWTTIIYTPIIRYRKGTRKDDIEERFVSVLKNAVSKIREEILHEESLVEEKTKSHRSTLESPFIKQGDIDIAVAGALEQLSRLRQRVADCKRLEALCE